MPEVHSPAPFLSLTREYVQACNGLAETGIVDEDTWQKLLGQEAQPQVAFKHLELLPWWPYSIAYVEASAC